MKNFKKHISLVIATIIGLNSFSALSTITEVSAAENDGEVIELEYWYAYGGASEVANLEMVNRFNELHDDIQVTATGQGSYFDMNTKVQTSFVSGNTPDLFIAQDTIVETFALNQMIEPLSPLIERDNEEVQIDDFVPGLLGNSIVDDTYYGLPMFKSTPLLYVNKTMLDEAGIELSQLETWDGFSEAARQLTTDEVTGVSNSLDVWLYESWVAQAGGSILNEEDTEFAYNNEQGVAAFDFMRNLVNEGAWNAPSGSSSSTSDQEFLSQKSGLFFYSTAALSALLNSSEEVGFELEAIMLPRGEQQAVTTGGSNIVMSAGLDEATKEAAWTFLKFVTSTEQNQYASQTTGYLPTRYSTTETAEYQALIEEQPLYKVAFDQLEFAEARPMVPGYNEMGDMWVEEAEKLLNDENISTQDGMNSAVERSNQILQ